MAKPPQIPMPSAEDFLLPQRAYLMAYQQQALFARREAIADSRAHLDEVLSKNGTLESQLALLGLIGDSMQAVEDLGNLAAASMDGLTGLASYVKATIYRSSHVNNFYAQIHKRDLDYFLQLCGFLVEPYTMFDFFELVPPPSAEEKKAFEAAERATAKLIREYLLRLAGTWERYRRSFHAYKHAALVANPDEVEIVDEHESPIDGVVIWARMQPEAKVGSHATGSLVEVSDDIQAEGKLALEVTEFLLASRLQVLEWIPFDADGNLMPNPTTLKVSPWRFWMRTGDITDADVAHLKGRGINLDSIHVP
jgi:hypothetical protein